MRAILLILIIGLTSCTTTSTENVYREALYQEDQHKLKEAFKLYLLSAKGGHVRSQYHVGSMYSRGRGVDVNCNEGLKWLMKASDSGDMLASFAISVLAKSSIAKCGFRDIEMSEKYRERAYEQGYQRPNT